jgi:hypothetical protein
MVLNSSKSKETAGRNKPAAAIGSQWEFWCAHKSVQLIDLVGCGGLQRAKRAINSLPNRPAAGGLRTMIFLSRSRSRML